MTARIYFAGMEECISSKKSRDLYLSMDVRDILVSFMPMRTMSYEKLDSFFTFCATRKINVAIDSGVYTMMSTGGITRVNMETYYQEYLNFLLRYRGYYEWAVNLDLDCVEGFDREWSDYFLKRFRDAGIKNMRAVWHYERSKHKESLKRLEQLMNENDRDICVGTSYKFLRSKLKDHKPGVMLDYFFSKYQENKVHFLGLTDLPIFLKYPVYSGDSCTWVQNGGFGTTIFFNGLRFKFIHRTKAEKMVAEFDRIKGHATNFKKALNSIGEQSGKCRAERIRNSLQAFLYYRDLVQEIREARDKGMVLEILVDPRNKKEDKNG